MTASVAHRLTARLRLQHHIRAITTSSISNSSSRRSSQMSHAANGIAPHPTAAVSTTSSSDSAASSPSSSSSLPSSHHLQPVPDVFPMPAAGVSQLIVLGAGSSSGIPRGACILTDDIKCKTCLLALQGRPEDNRNWRGNPSVLIRYYSPALSAYRHVQIDCGKTFRESMLRWYPRHRIHGLHAVLLTHEHADATLGLDDLRSLQRFDETSGLPLTPSIPIILSAHSLNSIHLRFPYLVDTELSRSVIRRVAQLSWHVKEAGEDIEVEGLPVRILQVAHGPDYAAWGFSIAHGHVVYISDVSSIPEETDRYLLSLKGDGSAASACPSCALLSSSASASLPSSSPPVSSIHLLVVDSLFAERPHPTHFSLPEALDCIRRYRPHRALLIGISDSIEYGAVTRQLQALRQEEGLCVELCFDGQSLDLQL